MRPLIILLFFAFLGLQYKLWFSDSSIFQWLKLEKKLNNQEQQNQKLAARNRALEADIAEFKSGEQALEEQARNELGMIKEGEVFYQCEE